MTSLRVTCYDASCVFAMKGTNTLRLSDIHYCVQAVAKKDLDPNLCHLDIKDQRATGYGGRISLSTPISVKFDVRPHAKTLWKALQATTESGDIDLYMTGAGRLGVKQGKFRAFINCLSQEDDLIQLVPQGEMLPITEEFYQSIVALAPFMSTDASRPWAQGLKLGPDSTFATNNIILIQRWHGANIPVDCIIPSDAVQALLKINQIPVAIQYNQNSLAFHFENDRWLCTHLIAQDGGWGRAEQIFEHNTNLVGLEEVNPELYTAIDILKDMLVERKLVYLKGDRVCTSATDEEGASIETPVADGPIFHAEYLRSLKDVATKINFSSWPKPCYFVGDKLRGVIVGLRE